VNHALRRPRRVLVTGAASGIGLETALQLAQRGDHVIVADRNVAAGNTVAERIIAAGGRAEFRALDLADLACIRDFAAHEVALGLPLHVLINNAGLLPPMVRATTRDGFELEFGVAHLGHFALTGLLMPALTRASRARVVSVASIAHASGRIDFDDLQHERGYRSYKTYCATKLACLMFALELHRRATSVGSGLLSLAAHPGVSITPIAAGWEQEDRRTLWDRLERVGYRISMRFFAQTAADGARSLVHAASAPDVTGGAYYGPTGFGQMGGPPGLVRPKRRALDTAVAARLWERSEELTGVRYEAIWDQRS
jgi:NAD(P)-dependent dehydrogenase (short-subunit alcohol dehydrogenase family)